MGRVIEQCRGLDEAAMTVLAESVRECVERGLVEQQDLADMLGVAELVLDCDSEVTCESWSLLVGCITPQLPESAILTLATPLILRLCNYSRPIFVRKAGVGLLSVLSSALPRSFPTEILDKMNLLTQDTSYEVRKCTCAVLPKVLSDLGTADQLFPSVERLLLDEEIAVKRAAVEMFASVFQLFSADLIAEKAVSLLVNEILPMEDSAYIANLMQGIGLFLSVLCGNKQYEVLLSTLLQRYQIGLKDSETMKLKGLAAFYDVCQAVNSTIFDYSLRPIYLSLSTDSSSAVRQAASALFPQLIHYLESFPEDLRRLSEGFLSDNDCKWQVISRIYDWPQSLLSERVMEMLRDTLINAKQWRLRLLLVSSLQKVLTPSLTQVIYDLSFPTLLALLHTSPALLRKEITSFLLQLLHHTYQSSHRQLLLTRLLEDFAQSKTWTDRLVYIDFCLGAVHLVSGEFFRRYFVRNVLGMAVDPVTSIRIRIAMGLDEVKWAIAGDEAAEALLHEALVRLCEDRCTLIVEIASETQSRMISPGFIKRLESGDREKEEENKRLYERSMNEYERTVEEQRRKRIIEDLAAKTRASQSKDKQHSYKRNSLKIPKAAVTTKSRLSFSEDHADSPKGSSPKGMKSSKRMRK